MLCQWLQATPAARHALDGDEWRWMTPASAPAEPWPIGVSAQPFMAPFPYCCFCNFGKPRANKPNIAKLINIFLDAAAVWQRLAISILWCGADFQPLPVSTSSRCPSSCLPVPAPRRPVS
jgi:hypothetical protein